MLDYSDLVPESLQRSRRAWKFACAFCDYMCRYLLHLIICGVVLMSPHIWSSPVYYMLAFNGMLYVNYVNFSDNSLPASEQGSARRKAALSGKRHGSEMN